MGLGPVLLLALGFGAAAPAWADDGPPGGSPRGDPEPLISTGGQPGPGGPRELTRAARTGRPFRLGLLQGLNVGYAGRLSNPAPGYVLGLDLAFPTGRSVRYHLELALETLNGATGVHFAPLTLGYEWFFADLGADRRIGVEFAVCLVRAEALFAERYSIALSSGFRATALLSWHPGFVGLTLIGAEFRYAYGQEDVGIRTGVGVNWPFQLTLGVEL